MKEAGGCQREALYTRFRHYFKVISFENEMFCDPSLPSVLLFFRRHPILLLPSPLNSQFPCVNFCFSLGKPFAVQHPHCHNDLKRMTIVKFITACPTLILCLVIILKRFVH